MNFIYTLITLGISCRDYQQRHFIAVYLIVGTSLGDVHREYKTVFKGLNIPSLLGVQCLLLMVLFTIGLSRLEVFFLFSSSKVPHIF